MQLLPNFDRAIMPVEKLREYALDMKHPKGRHKALVFRDVLGIERQHSDTLGELIRTTLPLAPAQLAKTDQYGDYWTTYHHIVGLNGRSAVVTVAWIFKKTCPTCPN